jgi:6,7-dimethyl-8-ribityllumazine synthase
MKKILIVSAEFYPEISSILKKSTTKKLVDFDVDFFIVPGVFEIPVVISKYIDKYDGFIALGCVIKGETPHFDLISKSVIDGIMNISIKSKKPIGNGILTCLNKKQSLARAKKGGEAADAIKHVLMNDPKK